MPSARDLALALALLVPAAALAGCVDDPEAPAASVEAGGSTDLDELSMPDNRTGEFNAFQETNRTEEGVGGMEHDHDYWLGRDRVEIFRGRYAMDVQPSQQGADAVFTMPLGSLVFEGTAKVEFLVDKPERHACDPSGFRWNTKHTCTDDNGFGLPTAQRVPESNPPTLTLYYQHAASGRDDWVEAGPLEWGVPFSIPVKPEETDMPHSTTSLWRFRTETNEPVLGSTLTFEAAATIVRGDDVPAWPGHPDFYADTDRRVVYDGPSSTREGGFGGDVFGFNDSLRQEQPGKLISYGTTTLHVFINVTKINAPPEQGPTHWYLYYHNATGDWWSTDLFDDNMTIDRTNLYWVIPVDENGMDSPYQPESRWEFLLRGTKDYAAFTCYGGCATYAVEYDMKIIATNEDLPEAAYSVVQDA